MKRQKNFISADSLNSTGIINKLADNRKVVRKITYIVSEAHRGVASQVNYNQKPVPAMKEITVQELHLKKKNGDSFFLLDVREPFEYQISNIDGKLIPLDQLSDRLEEIDVQKNEEVIVMCRSGSRSAKATKMLIDQGFSNVKNLKGGVNEWAREIDSSLPIY